MKINWAERLIVNSPIRLLVQRRLVRWFKQKSSLQPGARILEVGCGRGAGAAMLKREFAPGELQALDVDLEMIRQARDFLPPRQNGIFLYVGDVEHLPYPDATLDAVFGFGVLHHLPDWRKGLGEIARVLKPGGRYFVEEFYPPLYLNFLLRRIFLHPEENRFYSTDLHRAMSAAGFAWEAVLERPSLGIIGVALKEG